MHKIVNLPYKSLTLGCLILVQPASTLADWQERRLLEPTATELQREQQGKIFIYDGLKSGEVDKAMDTQFQRIDNMMFIRTVHPPASPDMPENVDDDCG